MADETTPFGGDEIRAMIRDAAERHRELGLHPDAVALFEDVADLDEAALLDAVGMLAALGQEIGDALERGGSADGKEWH